jgi:hypothetical protein
MSDIKFLCDKTKLSEEKLLTLIDKDYLLILDSLCNIELKDEPISFDLYCKLIILKETKNVNYPLAEKAYVADCISAHYPKVHKDSHYAIDNKHMTESTGKFYLILTGMFPEFLIAKKNKKGAPDLTFYIGLAKQGLKQSTCITVSDHVDDWVNFLYYIKKFCWK